MTLQVEDLPLSEDAKERVRRVLQLASEPTEVSKCSSCQKPLEVMDEKVARELEKTLPGEPNFEYVDFLCQECADSDVE